MLSQLFEPTIAGTALEAVSFVTNILESSTEYSIIGKDLDGNIVLWNEGARRIYGYEAVEVVGKANAAILHTSEDVSTNKPREIMEVALREGKWEGTLSRQRKNGECFTARATVTPRRDSSGRPLGFLLISKDITEETAQKKAMEEQERFFTLSLDLLCIIDNHGCFKRVNNAVERILGFKPEEFIGTSAFDYIHPDDIGVSQQALSQVVEGQSLIDFVNRYRCRDGSYKDISWVTAPYGDQFYATGRDITEQLQAEKAVRESQARFAGIVNSAMDALITIDVAQRITLFNPAAEQMFGYAAAAVLGQAVECLIPERFRAAHGEYIRHFGQTGMTNRRMGALGALSGLRANGDEFPIEASISQIEIAGQKLFSVILRDTSERRKAEKELRSVLTNARCILWRAEVRDAKFEVRAADDLESGLQWHTQIQDEYAAQQVLPLEPRDDLKYEALLADSRHPEDRLRINEAARHAILQGATSYEQEFRCLDKFSRTVWLHEEATIVPVGTGHWEIYGVATDVTQRKQAEIELREVMTHARCMLWSGEVEGLPGWDGAPCSPQHFVWRLTMHNEQAAQHVIPLVVPFGGSYLQTWADSRLPDDGQMCGVNAMNALLRGDDHVVQEYRCTDKHGELHWLHEEFTIQPVKKGLWNVFGVCTDITERKQAEEAIRELQRFLQSTVDALSTHIAVLDETGTIIAINEAWCKFAEDNAALYSKIGLGVNYLEVCDTATGPHGSEAPRAAAGIRAVMKGECVQFALEYPCHSLKEQRWFLLRATRFSGQGSRRIVIAHENITDRKLAEDALREGEERLRIVTENARVGLVMVNTERHYTFANAAYAEMFGLSPTDIVGRRVADVLASVYEKQIRPNLDRAFAGERVAYELHRPTPAGDHYYAARYEPTNLDGLVSVVVVITDITERKQAEQELQRSEARLRLFIEHAPAALAMFDREMRYLSVSRRWLSDYGLEGRDLIGLSHYEVFPEVPQHWKDIHQRALAGEVLRADEDCFERADGSIQWLKWEVRPWRGADAQIAGLLIFSEDITPSKAAETALHDSEERFRQMAETINEVFWMTDPDTSRMLYISPAYERIWGRSCQSLYDRPLSFIEAIHPEDRPSFLAILEDKTGQGDFETEYRIIRPDGEVRWIWDRGYPIRNESGAIYRVAGIAQDITERKAAEAALKTIHEELEVRVETRTSELAQAIEGLQAANEEAESARNEAERANHSKSEFLSRMSHELRTPLNAIIGFGQILEMRSGLNAKDSEAVEHILKGGQHLLGLINEVLDIARIEAGRLSISPEPIPVAQAIRDALGIVRPLAAPRDIAIVNALPTSDERHVLADRQRFHQVLLNLLSNAIKYNRDGGQVTISCGENEGFLRLSVRDTGAGLTSAELRKLFVPFERLGAAKTQIEGTGIGLALCKRLVEAMEGRIGVESTPGQGSVFWVEFALVQSPSATLQQSEESWLYADAETDGQTTAQHTVLYIEDNLSNLRLIENILDDRSEIKLISAMQGGIGLELARRHLPDLILLDLHLPDMLGDEVLRRLQAEPVTRAIPVVMLSADATPGQIERMLGAGAKAYLTKPLNLRQFLQTLAEVLEDKHDSC